MIFPGQGKKVVLTRKFAGRELKRELATDAIVGAKILEMSDIQETDPKDASTPVQKYRTIRVNGAGARSRQGTAVLVFENDGTLNIFDACQVGDLVDISAQSMRGSRGGFGAFKAFHVTPSENEKPAPPQVV